MATADTITPPDNGIRLTQAIRKRGFKTGVEFLNLMNKNGFWMARPRFYRLLRNETGMNANDLKKFCLALDISADYFIRRYSFEASDLRMTKNSVIEVHIPSPGSYQIVPMQDHVRQS